MTDVRLLKLACLFAATTFAAFGSACDVDDADASAATQERQPIGKSDALEGSCGTAEANTCGGPADQGTCWCDEQCAEIGDCCADKASVCDDTLVACEDLDPDLPADDAQCEARVDCAPILVPACPVCQGGSIICVTVEPVACEDLDPVECDMRPDCASVIEPACPVCPGGSEVCVTVE